MVTKIEIVKTIDKTDSYYIYMYSKTILTLKSKQNV